MIDYYQETDSKIIFPFYTPESFLIEPKNETIGGILDLSFSPLLIDSNLVKPAWDAIRETENPDVAKEARRLLLIIREMIISFQQFEFELGHLPPLQGFNVDDGSVLLEWIFNDFRIGISIEPASEESGWYLVSNANLGQISASGYISGIDINNLILWLLNFILSNS